MANPIRRVVELVLNRKAAEKTERDAKQTLSVIDGAIESVRRTALKLAAGIAAAFALNRIREWGRAAVAAALEAEKSVLRLNAAYETNAGAVGRSFDELQAFLRGVRDTTLFGQEELELAASQLLSYKSIGEETFERVIVLGTDLASVFGGLESSVSAIARAMDDPIRGLGMLAQQGFTFEDSVIAQVRALAEQNRLLEAQQILLSVLESESGGIAAAMRSGWTGAIKTYNDAMNDLQTAIGDLILNAGAGVGIMETMTRAIQRLTAFIEENADVINAWVLRSLNVAVIVTTALFNAIRGLGEIIVGFTFILTGSLIKTLQWTTDAFVLALEAASKFGRFLGLSSTLDGLDQFTARIRAQTTALKAWADAMMEAGAETSIDGFRRFGQASHINAPNLEDGPKPRQIRLAPNVESGEVLEQINKVQEIMDRLNHALDVSSKLAQVLGGDYDELAARVRIYSNALEALIDAGLEPTDERIQSIHASLVAAQQAIIDRDDAIADILERKNKALEESAILAGLLGDEYDEFGARASILRGAIEDLIEAGLDPLDERVQAIVKDFHDVIDAARLTGEELGILGELSNEVGTLVHAALTGNIKAVASGKIKMNVAEAAEQFARAAAASAGLFTAAMAPAHIAAGKQHLAVAGMWAAIAGGAAAFGGGGSVAPTMSRGVGGLATERMSNNKVGPPIIIHVDGVDPSNPRHQRLIHEAGEQAARRYGTTIEYRSS